MIQQCYKQMNDLEQDYFQQMNQLFLIKQTLIDQYQKTLIHQLTEIDHVIQQKLPNKTTTTTINAVTPIKLSSFPLSNPICFPSSIPTPSNTSPSSHNTYDSDNTNNTNNSINENNNGSYPDVTNVNISNLLLPGLNCIHQDAINNTSSLPKIEPIDQQIANGINSSNSSTNIIENNENMDMIMHDIKHCKKDIKPLLVECNLCHQAFDSQKSLRKHLDTIHTFKCDLCSKSFQKKIDLKRHQRLHDGTSSIFECKICFKTYTSPGSLHNHMRIHQESNLFRCEYCNKGFTQNHHLKRHLRIHTGISPFNCRYCNRPFKYKTSCQRHEKTVHKDIYVPIPGSGIVGRPKKEHI